MSDTQKVTEKLRLIYLAIEEAKNRLEGLPFHERAALVPTEAMLAAAANAIERRWKSHNNALEVQS